MHNRRESSGKSRVKTVRVEVERGKVKDFDFIAWKDGLRRAFHAVTGHESGCGTFGRGGECIGAPHIPTMYLRNSSGALKISSNLEHPLFLFTPFILKDLERRKGEKIQQQ